MSGKKDIDTILQEYLAEEERHEREARRAGKNGGQYPPGTAFASLLANIDRRFALSEIDAQKRHNEMMLVAQATSSRVNMIAHRMDILESMQKKLAQDAEDTGRHAIASARAKAKELEKEKREWVMMVAKVVAGLMTMAVGALAAYYFKR